MKSQPSDYISLHSPYDRENTFYVLLEPTFALAVREFTREVNSFGKHKTNMIIFNFFIYCMFRFKRMGSM